MTASAAAPPPQPPPESLTEVVPREEQPWVKYAIEQALLIKSTTDDAVRTAARRASSRLSDIGSTASAHSQMTLEMAKGYMEEYDELAVTKLKEGILIAAGHPWVSCGVAAGLGMVAFRGPRHFLLRLPRRLFMNEEVLLSRAETRANELRHSVANMIHEGKKLEERAAMAENDFLGGRTRLRQAGHQIQGVINTIYKIEKQTRGLKDIIGELPRKDASVLRSKVSSLTSELKNEKKVLSKAISKITGYGIPV